MSTQQNHYLLVGAKFDYYDFYQRVGKDPNDFWDVEERYHDSAFKGIYHHNDLCIISDGMDCQYVYVGHVLQKSENYGGLDDYVNDKPTPEAETVKAWIKAEFGLDVECSIYAFTHYR